jgi:hypothetical protein
LFTDTEVELVTKSNSTHQESPFSEESPQAIGGATEAQTDGLREWIARAAYFRAERRGFAPGSEIDDWLEAENEIQAIQQGQASSQMSA